MKKSKEVISYFENLNKNKAIYLWGANSEIITRELCDKLYNTFGSSKYSQTYYNNKYKEGKGKIGADCSGSFKPMSGFDTTAQGYYDECKIKGTIDKIDKLKPCLVFRCSNNKMVHVGFYLGNNYTIEMESSKLNCTKKYLDKGTWTHYGIPNWIDYSDWNSTLSQIYIKNIQRLIKTNTDINIRTEPSTSSKIKGIYKKNSIIEVKGITGSWYKDINGNYITANKKYVSNLVGIVSNCFKLNMRSINNTTGKIIIVLNKGDKLNLLKLSNGWYYAEFKGLKGWINKKYIEF